jgi:hypothetical protein
MSSGIMIAIFWAVHMNYRSRAKAKYAHLYHNLFKVSGIHQHDYCLLDVSYLALAIVAMDIPVEPTVPSNILEPV